MGKKRIFSEEEVKEICRLYVEEGLSSRETGKIIKSDRKTVIKILKENGSVRRIND